MFRTRGPAWVVVVLLFCGAGCTAMAGDWFVERGTGGDRGAFDGGGGASDGHEQLDPSGQGDALPEGAEGCRVVDEEENASCSNGYDDDGDELVDCTDLDCRACTVCCAAPAEGLGVDVFESCASLARCGWLAFQTEADGDGAVRLGEEGGRIYLGGDGVAEAGLYRREAVRLAGEPTVVFRAALNEGLCSHEGCRHAVGVVWTAQAAPNSGAGVEPYVGVLLDGEQQAVHFFVNGRREHSRALELVDLTSPSRFAFRVTEWGQVQFWVFRDESLPVGQVVASAPDYESVARVELPGRAFRLALFGRLAGEAAAWVDGVTLDRFLCDLPENWSDSSPGRVLAISDGQVRAPSVVVRPGGGLLMAFENNGRLELAFADAGGALWQLGGPALTDEPVTRYGRGARRSPALLYWPHGPQGGVTPYHLWYVGEGELADSVVGVTPTAIVHARSSDGVYWEEDWEWPLAIEAVPEDLSRPLLAQVHAPHVLLRDELLVMWFVGRDPGTGATNVFGATSTDGQVWSRSDTPLFELLESEASAWDWVGEPTGFWRDGAYHMWYVGGSGATTSVGYALSATGHRWQHQGPVLVADQPWHEGRLGGPAVVLTSSGEGGGARWLRLWYQAGSLGREALGLAWQWLP